MMPSPLTASSLELWGGLECTVNRVGNCYFDQIARSGHDQRISDIDAVADLGIRTLRYPVLWEWAARNGQACFDWTWADERLPYLRKTGIRPVVGLVHHGSGPPWTNLLDPDFAPGLAAYASQLSARFPWVDAYTPVNEPFTTARFSGLYGHWYPHAREPRLCFQALLHQVRATVLTMEAIRHIRSDVQLVQTEDLGKTHSTPALQYQADFENERRWITFDLLCGRVDRSHPLAGYFAYIGLAEKDWLWFQDHPCVPEIIGVNYYVTSERFLDDRVDQYPNQAHGGNGQHIYVDLEAVRAAPSMAGLAVVLQETYARYAQPIAVTEAHLGCTREEQMRWLVEIWNAADEALKKGVDVRAVTIWALLGSYDWDSLVTQARGHYESGAFDLRSDAPRPTALARLAQTLARGEAPDHPVLDGPGWWQRRLVCSERRTSDQTSRPRRGMLLLTQSRNALYGAFRRICKLRGLEYRVCNPALKVSEDPSQVEALIRHLNPWAVIHTGGGLGIDAAEWYPDRCYRENVTVPLVWADACVRHGICLVTFSTDLVFDGASRSPYRESDAAHPLSVYGRCKVKAENEVLQHPSHALVIRSGSHFGPWDRSNFLALTRRTLREKGRIIAPDDVYSSPAYLPDVVNASLDLLIDGETGIWHVTNSGSATWAELGHELARREGFDQSVVRGRPANSFGWAAQRPLYSVLAAR